MLSRALIAAALLFLTVAPAMAQSADGSARSAGILRAGPGSDYPRIARIGRGEPLEIYGCVDGYDWCDVATDNDRGWFPGDAIVFDQGGRPVLLPEVADEMGIGILGFSRGDYWGHHYRNRPFFSEPRWSREDTFRPHRREEGLRRVEPTPLIEESVRPVPDRRYDPNRLYRRPQPDYVPVEPRRYEPNRDHPPRLVAPQREPNHPVFVPPQQPTRQPQLYQAPNRTLQPVQPAPQPVRPALQPARPAPQPNQPVPQQPGGKRPHVPPTPCTDKQKCQ